jgi:predicted secreted protein
VGDDTRVRVAYLAHCLLNVNSKVADGALCAGVSRPLVDALRERGYVLRQLPCPEVGFAGMARFWAVREQYDTRAYRRHCQRLAQGLAPAIAADIAAGGEVVLIGIDGSPSMGVRLTATDPSWRGQPSSAVDEPYPVAPGRGVFVEVLLTELAVAGLPVHAVGIGQDLPGYDETAEVERIERELDAARGSE